MLTIFWFYHFVLDLSIMSVPVLYPPIYCTLSKLSGSLVFLKHLIKFFFFRDLKDLLENPDLMESKDLKYV